ncbi:MAG TPA: DUF4105 domain-containing protein [Gemmatimonadaceae bacterium]|nr:DUF4105 domain-containing protein [Gemmatimonadaceae bacterium]
MIVALLAALLSGASAQNPAPAARPAAPAAPAASVPGGDVTVYLMTMGTGDQVWERFGHNAIRIVDASRGTDSVYNWGTFDFHQPNFLRRFMTGNTLYWMQGDGMEETMATYRYLNRSVWVQELDLTPAERAAFRDFIAWSARPENRYYRYDYYLDNCSTRVRDAIDRIVGGQLKAATASHLTGTSYRFYTQLALRDDRAVAMGTNIGLGEVADRDISQWEEAFLPAHLQRHVRSLQIRAADGTMHSLVKNEQQLFAAQRPAAPAAPPNVTIRNAAIGVMLAGLLALLSRAAQRGRGARRAFATVATIWAALNGLLGVILIVGWAATRHAFMARNENLLQFDPLSLMLAALLPLAIMRGRSANLTRQLATIVAVVSIVGLAMKLLPWFAQVNVAVIAMTLPAHLVLAWAVRTLVAGAPERSTVAARATVSRSAA